jgi:Ca-activated chloride channel family protein
VIHFAQPGWLWLMILVPLPWLMDRARPRITWPSLDGFPPMRRISWLWLRQLPTLLCALAIGALAVALARPQTVGGWTRIAAQGVAIVVALDQSSSMNTLDFPTDHGTRNISRLDAAKKTFVQFVEARPDDLIGLVIFANYPGLACPPMLNHPFLIESVANVRTPLAGDDGTNIGDAIAVGLDALLVAPPKKKVLILLTDGHNEPSGPKPLDPVEGAMIARGLGITLHTIAIGHVGGPPPGFDPTRKRPAGGEVEGPNLPLLENLAQLTGGRSFIATDADALNDVFRTIDSLEKSPIRGQILTRYNEHFAVGAGVALILLLMERFLRLGKLGRLP